MEVSSIIEAFEMQVPFMKHLEDNKTKQQHVSLLPFGIREPNNRVCLAYGAVSTVEERYFSFEQEGVSGASAVVSYGYSTRQNIHSNNSGRTPKFGEIDMYRKAKKVDVS